MDPEDPEDVELLESLWRGDVDAFERLYQRHAPTVMRYAWRRLEDRAAAEEILQETFLTAWAKRRHATVVELSILPWLLSIAGNHLRNTIRKAARRHAVALGEVPEARQTDPSGSLAVQEALASLTELDRRICELCLIEGYSYRQAAAEVELTASAVGKRLQRARARLRHALGSAEE